MTAPTDTPGDIKGQRKDLHVGIISTSFPVGAYDPSGIFVKRLVESLSSLLDVTVLTPDSHRFKGQGENISYGLIRFRYGPRKLQRLAHEPGGIPDAIRRGDLSLLLVPFLVCSLLLSSFRLAGRVNVIHGNWTGPAIIGAIAARFRGKPAIATLRGEDLTRARSSPIFRAMLRSCLRLNQRIVCVSEAMHRELVMDFPKFSSKVSFIPNGVAFRETADKSSFRDPLRLITVGSLIERKRVDVILSAIAAPRLQGQVLLRVVGDGPQASYLTKLANDLGIVSSVDFIGQVSPDQVNAHLSWADAFVFASESEGRPNVVLEGMAASLPIISSDIDGVRELLEPDCGLLYPSGDSEELAQNIGKLIDDQTLAVTLGHAARRKIDELGLTWENTAAKYVQIYEELTA